MITFIIGPDDQSGGTAWTFTDGAESFATPERAFRCAAAWQREIARGASQRHAGIIARAEACSDGLFTDDDACAAIEAADLAAGGA